MDKLKMAHEYAKIILESMLRNDIDLLRANELASDAWDYADAMQVEADKRNKEEAAKQSAEVHDLIGKAHFHYCENGACVHCGKSEKTIDDEMWRRVEEARAVDEEEWQPDWSVAPKDATGWKIKKDRAYWIDSDGWIIKSAPSFGFTGSHIVERPHGL